MFDLMTNQNFSFNFKRNIFLTKILANAPLSNNICKYMHFNYTYIHTQNHTLCRYIRIQKRDFRLSHYREINKLDNIFELLIF